MITSQLAKGLLRLTEDLRALGAEWALVGGLAVSGWTEPRTTRDIDVAVAVAHDEEAEALSAAMLRRGYQVHTHIEHTDAGRLSTMRLIMPGQETEVVADLLFGSSGIEPELVAAAVRLEIFAGFYAPVATVGHLLALKVLALRPDRPQERPQDFADIRELLRVADAEEIHRARHALDLISRRGFDRGKDLPAEFEEQLHQFDERAREP